MKLLLAILFLLGDAVGEFSTVFVSFFFFNEALGLRYASEI